jgi:pimeloyl-ACP methyl ester carboxylesterase
MQYKNLIIRLISVFLIFQAISVSCRKDESVPENKYFISKELHTSLSESYISNLVGAASILYPEAGDLRPLVTTGVDIYKVVYETTIKGQKIRASGVVGVPVKEGDYPVLSFQNGTNTVNSNAPSELPSDKGFQMIEVVASMGYVVVIADYPGFGESSEIPHPYLVAEPTVTSLVDLLYAVKEMDVTDLPAIQLKNEYYLIGYSQGGWATLQLHKALELDHSNDFHLSASMCGAGPYNIYLLMEKMFRQPTFPQPYYIGYVINAYKAYDQFTNPITDILREPYASRVPNLYTGQLNAGQINSQLTTSIPDLVNPDFIAGFGTSPKYASIKDAMIRNSIAPWKTNVPLLMIHGDADTHVDPSATENMYNAMVQAGTSESVIKKVILPGADHGDGVVPAILLGLSFFNDIRNAGQ